MSSMKSTWNGGGNSAKKESSKRITMTPLLRGIIVGLTLVVLIGIIVLISLRKEDQKPVKELGNKSKPVTRGIAKTTVKTPKTNDVPKTVEPPPVKRTTVTEWRDKDIPEDKKLAAYEKSLQESPLPNTSSNRLFRSGLEQVMGWVFTTEVGEMPPPLPHVADFDIVHLQEILNSKCEIKDTDTEKEVDAKQTVEFAKEELKKYLEKGGTPDEFLAYYHDQLKAAFQHRRMVMDEVIKVMRDDPELGEDFLKEANKGLAEKGIKEVVIPERLRKSLQLNANKGTSK